MFRQFDVSTGQCSDRKIETFCVSILFRIYFLAVCQHRFNEIIWTHPARFFISIKTLSHCFARLFTMFNSLSKSGRLGCVLVSCSVPETIVTIVCKNLKNVMQHDYQNLDAWIVSCSVPETIVTLVCKNLKNVMKHDCQNLDAYISFL